VRVEQPKFGASVRLVWAVSKPEESTWSLPVGQSGHIRSPHYRDLQADYVAGKPFRVFEEGW
jgi:penicillin amidase